MKRNAQNLGSMALAAALLAAPCAHARMKATPPAENLNHMLAEARCVPEHEQGRQVGYRCFQIAPGSVYDRAGLRNNDVLCGIDGEPLADPAVAFRKLAELGQAKAGRFTICVQRDGKKFDQVYDASAAGAKEKRAAKASQKQVKK